MIFVTVRHRRLKLFAFLIVVAVVVAVVDVVVAVVAVVVTVASAAVSHFTELHTCNCSGSSVLLLPMSVQSPTLHLPPCHFVLFYHNAFHKQYTNNT